jgi:hypothetical protein
MDTMEPRIALSSSNFFTDFFNSLLGKSTTSSTNPKPASHPAQVHTIHGQTALQIRQERLAAWHAAHPHAKA